MSGRAGVNLTVSVDVSLLVHGAPPKLLGLGWVEAWDISKQRIPRSFHLRPFIVLTITKRAHYKAKSEATCRVSVLKLVSPNQPDSQQLWGQSTSKPNARLGLGLGLGLGGPAASEAG